MLAGRLDRRITIERSTPVRDGFNNAVDNWAPLAVVWASKEDVKDGQRFAEALAGGETAAETMSRFQVRRSSTTASVTAKDRIVYGGRTYNIVSLKEIGRHEGIEFTAVARSDS